MGAKGGPESFHAGTRRAQATFELGAFLKVREPIPQGDFRLCTSRERSTQPKYAMQTVHWCVLLHLCAY
jgi:hypothetical protein